MIHRNIITCPGSSNNRGIICFYKVHYTYYAFLFHSMSSSCVKGRVDTEVLDATLRPPAERNSKKLHSKHKDRTVPAVFESHCGKLRFGILAIPFTPLCQCHSEETPKAVGTFSLVSMTGEVKDPTSPHWNM